MGYIREDKIERSNIDRVERQEIKEMAKESARFVASGGSPLDLPKHLRIKENG